MKIKTNSNLTSGILFLLVSIILYVLIPTQIKTRETSAVTAQTIPSIMIIGIMVFSIILIVQGLFFEGKKEYIINKDIFKSVRMRKELKSLIFIGMLIIYAMIFEIVGFVISSLLLSFGILLYYHVRKWWFYAIAAANIGIVYFVFQVLLRVSLP